MQTNSDSFTAIRDTISAPGICPVAPPQHAQLLSSLSACHTIMRDAHFKHYHTLAKLFFSIALSIKKMWLVAGLNTSLLVSLPMIAVENSKEHCTLLRYYEEDLESRKV